MADIWHLRSPSEVLREEIDQFLICYCGSTGETHILDAFPTEIMNMLASGPKTSAQLDRDLVTAMGEEPGGWVDSVTSVLEELSRLGLVDKRTP